MNPLRYLTFYITGLVAILAQIARSPSSMVPNLGASGAIAAVMGGCDQNRVILIILGFVRIKLIPAALLIGVWILIQLFNVGSVATVQTGGVAYAACRRNPWDDLRAPLRRSIATQRLKEPTYSFVFTDDGDNIRSLLN